MRLVTKTIHAYLDYPVAVSLMAMPFLLQLGGSHPLAKWLSVGTGVAALLLTIFTNHKLGVFRVLPYSVHLGIDFLVGIVFALAPRRSGISRHRCDVLLVKRRSRADGRGPAQTRSSSATSNGVIRSSQSRLETLLGWACCKQSDLNSSRMSKTPTPKPTVDRPGAMEFPSIRLSSNHLNGTAAAKVRAAQNACNGRDPQRETAIARSRTSRQAIAIRANWNKNSQLRPSPDGPQQIYRVGNYKI